MILTAKTATAYHAAARLPCSLQLGGMQVDIDPAFVGCVEQCDYLETEEPSHDRVIQRRLSE